MKCKALKPQLSVTNFFYLCIKNILYFLVVCAKKKQRDIILIIFRGSKNCEHVCLFVLLDKFIGIKKAYGKCNIVTTTSVWTKRFIISTSMVF